MKDIRGIIVLIMAVGLMGLLSIIIVDEFAMAADHDADLDQNIVELLQMSITGVIGVVAGYVGSKGKCNCKDD